MKQTFQYINFWIPVLMIVFAVLSLFSIINNDVNFQSALYFSKSPFFRSLLITSLKYSTVAGYQWYFILGLILTPTLPGFINWIIKAWRYHYSS